MITWKQIFGPNFSVEQIELVLWLEPLVLYHSVYLYFCICITNWPTTFELIQTIRLRKSLRQMAGTNSFGCVVCQGDHAVRKLPALSPGTRAFRFCS